MRVKIKVFVLIIVMNVCGLYAQDKSVSNIQLPSSPGMSIIGVQTSEISKPGNYTGLYSSLISPLVSNNGTIPTDLAMEFSPYYLVSRDIVLDDIERTDVYRDLKVSIASTKVDDVDSASFPRVGVGFKTYLMNGKLSYLPSLTEVEVAIPNLVEGVTIDLGNQSFGTLGDDNISQYTERIQKQIDSIPDNEGNRVQLKQLRDIKLKVEKILESSKHDKSKAITKLNKFRKELDRLVKVDESKWDMSLRTGGFLEFAGALAIDFPDNHIGISEVNRWGIWLNYTYRPEKSKLIDFGAILRMSNYSFDPTIILESKTVFSDVGVNLTFKVPDTKLSVSGEVLWKYSFSEFEVLNNESNTFKFKSAKESKWNFTLGYQINDDLTWTMSLSEINGNSDYLKDNAMQLLVGINAALSTLNR